MTKNASQPRFSICVYCGSSPGHDAAFTRSAAAVGRWIGEHGGQLVYGGGRSGLMGAVADAALAAGAPVVGIIPEALVAREHANRNCTELIVVQTMHERKRIMAERATAFLALPGGIGTQEEFFETWTWRQLGYHDKPIGLFNQAGYYDHLLAFLQAGCTHGFMHEPQWQLIDVDTQWQPLLHRLAGI